jgi:outer membrane biosynthesis protein TonB
VVTSAGRLATQRQQSAPWGLVLAAIGLMILLGASAVAFIIVARRAGSTDGSIAAIETKSPIITAAPLTPPDGAAATKTPLQQEPKVIVPPTPAPTPETAPLPMEPLVAAPAPTAPTPAPPPVPQPAPAPQSPPTPAPQSPPEIITRDEAQALLKALDAAKAALAEQNFKAADVQLAKAESLAKLPKHREAVARLKEVSGYVMQFRQAVITAVKEMQAGESFKVGASTYVAFVEASSEKVTLRLPGMNKTYPFNDLPPGLAVAIAEFKLPENSPTSRVIKGAYLLVHKRADSETHAKAKSLWLEAQMMGANISHLMPFLDDNYADLLKDAAAE